MEKKTTKPIADPLAEATAAFERDFHPIPTRHNRADAPDAGVITDSIRHVASHAHDTADLANIDTENNNDRIKDALVRIYSAGALSLLPRYDSETILRKRALYTIAKDGGVTVSYTRRVCLPASRPTARDFMNILGHAPIGNPGIHARFWPILIRELATHQRVNELCSLDPDGTPLRLRIKFAETSPHRASTRSSTTTSIAIIDESAAVNGCTPAQIRAAILAGEAHLLRPLTDLGMYSSDERAMPYAWTAGSNRSRQQIWLEDERGLLRCGTDRPWLPIAIDVSQSKHGGGHAILLLVNLASGRAYLFEPNGAGLTDDELGGVGPPSNDLERHAAYRESLAVQVLPPIYRMLVRRAGLRPAQWVTTQFVANADNHVLGQGPQNLQGVPEEMLGRDPGTCVAWRTLFYHLFILHPELEPDDILARMIDPAQRPYLGQIIGRYSMFLARMIREATSA